VRDGRPAFYGYRQRDPLWEDIKSCGTELAVSRFLGLPWVACAIRPEKVDVGENVQVRSTRDGFDLVLHDSDKQHHLYVLVYGTGPKFWFAGWGMVWELKEQARRDGDPYHTGRPAFWVPPEKLRKDWKLLRDVAW
jgi:hypothetical protein